MPSMSTFRLQVTLPTGATLEREFSTGAMTVGRAPGCDLVLDDPFLSRQHARFSVDGDLLQVEDLGSSNGTLVNDREIAEPTHLGPGDRVRLSDTMIAIDLVGRTESGALPLTRSESPSSVVDVRTGLGDSGAMTALRSMEEILADEAEAATEGSDLARYAARLKLLNDLHRDLGQALAVGEVLELVLDGTFAHLQPEEALVFLVDEDCEDDLELVASRPPGLVQAVSETLREKVMEEGKAALAVDVQSDERFDDARSLLASSTRSLMAAPLMDAEGCLGMIVLLSRLQVRAFTEEDLELLASIASAASFRVRNLRLARVAADRERLENELRFARRIQMSLLPKVIPQPGGYRILAANTPSRMVSGDYYQIVERRVADAAGEEHGETALLIADVCGKGTAAALLTATLEAVCAVLLQAGTGAAEVFAEACRFLYQRTPPDKFATACLALLSPETGEFSFVNAGHNPPLLVRANGEVEELPASGFPLGMVPESDYEAVAHRLAPGDMLFLFTDGIVEAEDPDEEEYGLDRLRDLCVIRRSQSPEEIAGALEGALDDFTRGAPQGDDKTYVIIQRRG